MQSHVIDALRQAVQHGLVRGESFVDGRWRPGGAAAFGVVDPSTSQMLAQVTGADDALVHEAIASAARAGVPWRERTGKARGELLRAWHALIQTHAGELAALITAEQGKPLTEARGEVEYAASFVEWYAEEARRVYGEVIPSPDVAKRFLVLRQPIGVCAAITPWNYPAAMVTRKVAPALAAGCTVVVKPAEQTPLTALALAELGSRAGLPAGVLSVLAADAEQSSHIGRLLCASDAVRHLSFTGSTEVGRLLATQCAPTLKKLALELGGNAPFIVFDDADPASAAEAVVASKFRNAGQACIAANRIYVQRGVHDRFVAELVARTRALTVGSAHDSGVRVGPLIDAPALAKVEALVADALARGARAVVGGRALAGLCHEPTVIVGGDSSMRCAREEIFGPVAVVIAFEAERDVIVAANDTSFGLAAYVCTRDMARTLRVAEALEYGMVAVNTGLLSSAEVPFGGVKHSGLGREGGRQGIDEYLETKYVCLGAINSEPPAATVKPTKSTLPTQTLTTTQ
jgi:succinate-semialdehyde dehydrogenase / glutarate-semialdehyde dehydrogenase